MSESVFTNKPIGRIETAIGPLTVFNITIGDQRRAVRELGMPLEKCSPSDFVKALLIYTCFPSDKLDPPNVKPPDPLLTAENLKLVSTTDIEAFAQLYIENNDYLFRKSEFKTTAGPKGTEVHSVELGEVVHPRMENESFTQYLHRLSVLQRRESTMERRKAIEMGQEFAKSLGARTFSSDLSRKISQAFTMGNGLKELSNSIQGQFGRPRIPLMEIKQPGLADLEETILQNKRLERRERLAPLEELGSKLDKIADISAKTVDYMVVENETQTRIAAAIKGSGDDAARYSKWNIILNCAVLVISLSALLVSIYVVVRDRAEATIRDQQLTNGVATLTLDLGNVVNALHQLQASQQGQDSNLVAAVQNVSIGNAQLHHLIQIQENTLKQVSNSDSQRAKDTQAILVELQKVSSALTLHDNASNALKSSVPTGN